MVKHLNELKPLIKRIPTIDELKLSGVLNSFVTCRTCRGKGFTYVRNRHNNTLDFVKCPMCNGTRNVSNRSSSYDK